MEEFISIQDDEEELVRLPIDWITLPRRANLNFLEKDGSVLLPLTAWKDWNEFRYVYCNLFDHFYQTNAIKQTEITKKEMQKHLETKYDSLTNLKRTIGIIEMWRSRNKNYLPICVDVTQQLLHTLYVLNTNGNTESFGRLLAMNIARTTNRLIDAKGDKTAVFWSKQMSFPLPLIAIRHDIVHEHLPSVATLKQHSILLLKWLDIHYWQYQINKIYAVCHENLLAKLLRLKHRTEPKSKHFDDVLNYLKFNLRNNHLSIMQYFIPYFIDECLLDVSCLKNDKTLDRTNLIQPLFTALFVKYNSLIQRLLEGNATLIAHFVAIFLQKRFKLLNSKRVQSKTETIKCGLMVIWSSTLLMDADNHKFWKSAFNKKELIFVFENVLNFVINFNDAYSKQLIQNIKKKAKQFHIQNEIGILQSINSMQTYVKPLMRNVKSDESMDKLIQQRLSANKLDQQLMSDIPHKKQNNLVCKWQKTTECRFLPIGHSILPPL